MKNSEVTRSKGRPEWNELGTKKVCLNRSIVMFLRTLLYINGGSFVIHFCPYTLSYESTSQILFSIFYKATSNII